MRDQFINSLTASLKADPRVVLLTADLGFGIFDHLEPFIGTQYFNVGVAEQLMSSLACGLSVEGFDVFCYSIGVFPTLRCLEQIRNDISYHNCNVTIVSSGAGFSYGSLGMSHHCIQDIGYTLSIPNISIYSPANASELSSLMGNLTGPSYLRLDKSSLSLLPISNINTSAPICYHKSSSQSDLLILFHGSIGEIAVPLMDTYSFDLFSVPTLPCGDSLELLMTRYSKIITIEEHSLMNGFFSYVSSRIALLQHKCRVIPVALPHIHHSIVGDQAFLRNYYGLDTFSLDRAINSLLSDL